MTKVQVLNSTIYEMASSVNLLVFLDNGQIGDTDVLGLQKVSGKPKQVLTQPNTPNASLLSELTLEAKSKGKPTLKNCGEVFWAVWWKLLGNNVQQQNTKGGQVIQNITIEWSITNCLSGKLNAAMGVKDAVPNPVHYWEAWNVPKTFTTPIPSEDHFTWAYQGCTKGKVTWKATAAFYYGLQAKALPSGMVLNNEKTLAGSLLPSTLTDPMFQDQYPHTAAVLHEMEIVWDCCAGDSLTIVNSRKPGSP